MRVILGSILVTGAIFYALWLSINKDIEMAKDHQRKELAKVQEQITLCRQSGGITVIKMEGYHVEYCILPKDAE